MLSVDIEHLQAWIGKTQTGAVDVPARPAAALSATLDRDDPRLLRNDQVPPLTHWLLFPEIRRRSELGPDGHPAKGDFLPPVPLARRMFAGSKMEFISPIRVGDRIERTSTVADVRVREGRSGPLVFVAVRHAIHRGGTLLLTEEQTIVYRDGGSVEPSLNPAPATAEWRRDLVADEVMLFRYSALTFNGHRIHYDHNYARDVEGYPGLVVHGPLLATLLGDLVRRNAPESELREFSFRALRPVFCRQAFAICGTSDAQGSVKLWVQNVDGQLAMEASARLETLPR